jgi:hypothetical protein
MKYLFLFESFLEKLNEIELGNHWRERSANPGEQNSRLSRIQPYSREFPDGWRLNGLLNNRRDNVSVGNFLEGTAINEDQLNKMISYALRELTRSEYIKNYIPPGDKRVSMIGLGKIGVYNGKSTAFAHLSTYNPKKDTWYGGGEGIWGVADRNMGITFYYLPMTKNGIESFYNSTRNEFKMSDLEFLENSTLVYPKGERFSLVIDATDHDLDSIKTKIKRQLLDQPIEYGPAPAKDLVTIRKIEPTRKTFSPGDDIKYTIKYIDEKEPLDGKILDIVNMDQIKKAQKSKSLSDIKEIKILFQPDEQSVKDETNKERKEKIKKINKKFKRTPDGKIIPITISFKDGSLIYIDGIKYKILGPANGKPLITAEPSILNIGNVQTWVEETPIQD